MIGIFSRGIAAIPYLESFLQDEVVFKPRNMKSLTGVAGWGMKPNAKHAIRIAKKYNIPYLALEDGFLRSVYPGVLNSRPLSLVVDPIGIYYDSTRPSKLENVLNHDLLFTDELLNQAREAMAFMKERKISKYNHAHQLFKPKRNGKPNILLVDQTLNDMSVVLGAADRTTFLNMVEFGRQRLHEANVYVKIHPDVLLGKKRGYLSEIPLPKEFVVISEEVNPIHLVEEMDQVVVASSQLGFEALVMGKEVVTFGLPYYASWGVTKDHLNCDRRKSRRTVEEIFAAAYILYPRYLRPSTGTAGTIMDVLHYIDKERNATTMATRYVCLNIPFWKRGFVRPFLNQSGHQTLFLPDVQYFKKGNSNTDIVVSWSYQNEEAVNKIRNQNVLRIEDGFYRSVGLGSNFFKPWSIVMDSRGLYFNFRQPSDLENILNTRHFDEIDLQEAREIRRWIVEHRLTKYNVEPTAQLRIPSGKKIIFVPGQVPDDASIRYGCIDEMNSIKKLLAYLRQREPDSFILFKPHPDVLSRNRKGDLIDHEFLKYCDHIETKASVLDCIEICDEVHTLTSQAGFDALLRNKPVYTYGGPFYAGWGLTVDYLDFPGRTRKLTIEELIAGTLLYYAKYFNHHLKQPCDCRSVLRKLARMKEEERQNLFRILKHSSRLRIFRKLYHALAVLTGME